MKKNWTLKAAGILLALTLITSCFVGGTFAKYVTSSKAAETARVAKFGVHAFVSTNDLFKTKYTTDDSGRGAKIIYSVDSNGSGDLVAPGTKSDGALNVAVSGTPEVAVNVAFKLDVTGDVFLKAGTYRDFTTTELTDGKNASFNLAEDYYPIVFTLKDSNGGTLVSGKLSEIKEYLENTLSQDITPNTDLTTVFTDALQLTWEWKFTDEANKWVDKADTLLGHLAADKDSLGKFDENNAPIKLDPKEFSTDISFTLSITVTQID